MKKSWMVGDGLNDVQAGRNAGCRTLLVTRLKPEQAALFFSMKNAKPDYVVKDLNEAFDKVVESPRRTRG